MTKYCFKCNKEFSDENNFCEECGEKLKKKEVNEESKHKEKRKLNKKLLLSGLSVMLILSGFLVLIAGVSVFTIPVPYTATEVYTEEEPYTTVETYYESEPYLDEDCEEYWPNFKHDLGDWNTGSNYYINKDLKISIVLVITF